MENKLGKIDAACTIGGPTIDGVRITYYDPKDPVVVVILKGKDDKDGSDLSVSLMLQKSDLYIIGYLLGFNIYGNEKWQVFVEGIEMKNQERAKFSHRYFDKDSDIKIMGNRIGGRVLLEAMKQLRDAVTPTEKRKAFQCIVYHISEAIRFHEMWKLVTSKMNNDLDYTELVTPTLRNLIGNWKSNSKDLHECGCNFFKKLRVGLMEEPKLKNEKADDIRGALHIQNVLDSGDFVRQKPKNVEKWSRETQIYFAKGWARRKHLNVDICTDIVRALATKDIRIAKLIVQNSYFFLVKRDLSVCIDYQGREYCILHENSDAMDRIITG